MGLLFALALLAAPAAALPEPPPAFGPAHAANAASGAQVPVPISGKDQPAPAPSKDDGAALGKPRRLADLAPRIAAALTLLGVAGWLALRQRRAQPHGDHVPAIDIVAMRALGKTQRLMVVDVDQQRFLLATSEQGGVRLISQIGASGTQDEGADGAEEDPLNSSQDFSDLLGQLSPDTGTPAAAIAPVPEIVRAAAEGKAAPPAPRPLLYLVDEPQAPAAHLAAASASESRSVDVAGLLALRRDRQGALRQ